MDPDQEQRIRCAGLPSYPPLDLQNALNHASHRWRVHATAVARHTLPPYAATPPQPITLHDTAAPQLTAALHGIHLLGTNHLCPWFAARVAEAVARQAVRGTPFASIAVELAPGRQGVVQEASHMMEPVLEELAHSRFKRMPDLRVLQRLTGPSTRQRVCAALEGMGLDAMDMRLFGFIEGMELLQAVRMGRMHKIPVTCVDTPLESGAQLAATLARLTDEPGCDAAGILEPQPLGTSTNNCGASSAGHVELGQGRPGTAAAGFKTRADRSQSSARGTKVQEGQGQTTCLPSHPLHALQAAWLERARGLLENGVDRGLVVGDEHACMKRYLDTWADPAALVRPWQLHGALQAGHESMGPERDMQEAHTGTQERPSGLAGAVLPVGFARAGGPEQVERELHMACHISRLPRPVLSVMGAAHVAGVSRALRLLLRAR